MYVDIGGLHMTSIENMIMQIMVNLPQFWYVLEDHTVCSYSKFEVVWGAELQAKDREFSIRLP